MKHYQGLIGEAHHLVMILGPRNAPLKDLWPTGCRCGASRQEHDAVIVQPEAASCATKKKNSRLEIALQFSRLVECHECEAIITYIGSNNRTRGRVPLFYHRRVYECILSNFFYSVVIPSPREKAQENTRTRAPSGVRVVRNSII